MEIDNLSNVFGGKVPGLNAPLRFSDAVKDKGIKIPKDNFENVAWKRMGGQKNLNLFGDIDNDKTLNIFDCAPYDRMKQAVVHKMVETPVGKLEQYKAGRRPNVQVIGPAEPPQPTSPSFGQKLKMGTYNVLRGTGIIKTEQEKEQMRQDRLMREKLRTEQLKSKVELEEQRAKLRDLTGGQSQPLKETKRVAVGTRDSFQGGAGAAVDAFGGGARMAGGANIDRVNRLIGMGGGGGGAYRALGLNPPMEQMSMQQPQTQVPGAITPGEEIFVEGVRYVRLPNGKWKNTKTGTEVSYPRGTYDRKPKVVYQPQPQPQLQQQPQYY